MAGSSDWASAVRRVLIVSEADLNRRLLAGCLARAGVARGALDCRGAVALPGSLAARPAPDLLVLDADQLGGRDAADAIREVRSRELAQGLRRVPMVTVGVDPSDESRRRLLEAGVDLPLSRPIAPWEVRATARALLTRVERPLRRILLVDDQGLNLRLARGILERAAPGVEVEMESDPQAGLARCLAGPPIDLLVVNGAMPVLPGPALIRDLRAAETRQGRTPMAVIIESAGVGYIEQGLEAGADLWCQLPWSAIVLVAAVRALFPGGSVSILPASLRGAEFSHRL